MKKEINDIIEKLLDEKGLTKEELLLDKIFCIRKYKPKISQENCIWHELRNADEKKNYPKGKVLEENPMWNRKQEATFEREHRFRMHMIFQRYELSDRKNIENACYDAIELLFDSILAGYAYILKNIDMYDKFYKKVEICKDVENYIKNNGYLEKVGRKQNFSYCNYSWFKLTDFKNLDDLYSEVYEEISDFLERYCYYVFCPEKFSDNEAFEKEFLDSSRQISRSLSVLKGEAREKYIEEIKNLLK